MRRLRFLQLSRLLQAVSRCANHSEVDLRFCAYRASLNRICLAGLWLPRQTLSNQCFNACLLQVSNVIFALFTEGLLKVCDKLSNPCSLEETSFSERVYGTFVGTVLNG
jgi:hypothetical protein